jgi:hypothetical protein
VIVNYQSKPHQWGPGKVHRVDPSGGATACGLTITSAPGPRNVDGETTLEEITCGRCRTLSAAGSQSTLDVMGPRSSRNGYVYILDEPIDWWHGWQTPSDLAALLTTRFGKVPSRAIDDTIALARARIHEEAGGNASVESEIYLSGLPPRDGCIAKLMVAIKFASGGLTVVWSPYRLGFLS